MIQIDTNRWHWLQIALKVDLQAIDPTADVENSFKQSRICKPQLMPVKTMTRALWFLQKAGKKLLARKVADLKSCWPQKLLARKVAGLKSCWRQKLLRWSEVLIETPFFEGFCPFLSCFLLDHWQFVYEMPFLQKRELHLTYSGRRSDIYKVPPRIGGHHFLLCQHTNTEDIAGQSTSIWVDWLVDL